VGARSLLGVTCIVFFWTGRDNRVAVVPWNSVLISEMCLIMGLCRGGEAASSAISSVVDVLSSGARCFEFFVIAWAWGCPFSLAGVGLFCLLGVRLVLGVFVQEGFVA